MAFEVFETKPKGTPPIPSGQMTIGSGGRCNFPAADLKLIGIREDATVLFDVATKLIAIRAPRRGDSPMRLCMTHGRLCKRLALSKVFRAMGVTPQPGRKPTTVDGGMLVFCAT